MVGMCIQDLSDLSPQGSQVGPEVARISSHFVSHQCFDFPVRQDVRKKKLGSAELRSLNLTLKAIGGVESDGAGGVRRVRKTRDRKHSEEAMGMIPLAQ